MFHGKSQWQNTGAEVNIVLVSFNVLIFSKILATCYNAADMR